MTNNYFKVTGASKIQMIEVAEDPAKVAGGEDAFRNVAASGYISWQEFFFFDERDPEQIRRAHEIAHQVAGRMGKGSRFSIYRRPMIGGPWDALAIVGKNPEELPS